MTTYKGIDLPSPVKSFLRVLVALVIVCSLTEVYCSRVLHYSWPYNSPIQPSTGRFGDFKGFQSRFEYFHTTAFFSAPGPIYTYPAPVALIYKFFYLFPHSTRLFLVTLLLTCVAGAILFGRELLRKGISRLGVLLLLGITLCSSYPLLFDFWQGNVEFVIAGVVSAGIWAYLTKRNYIAATCFGLAGACKIFPLIYLGLFLSRRQFRAATWMIFVAGAATLVGSWLLCPNLNISFHGVSSGLIAFKLEWVQKIRPILVGCDHSLFALFKFLLLLRTHLPHPSAVPNGARVGYLASVYLFLVAGAGTILYVTTIRKLPFLNQLLCLNTASILLPPVSFDYTLLHLYAPWSLLVLFALERRERFTPGLTSVFCSFAILMAPETEFIYHGQSFGGQIKAVTLLVLFILALCYRFPSSFEGLEPAHT